jgi:hypothetical protein
MVAGVSISKALPFLLRVNDSAKQIFIPSCNQTGFHLIATWYGGDLRRPQVFEKSGFACFSKTLASCIQFLLNAVWYYNTILKSIKRQRGMILMMTEN